jgi:hypothetical protein
MDNGEVMRLRRLRNSALQVRAIARAMGSRRAALDEPLISRGACASWRIARGVSGRLNGHPYIHYQEGAGIGTVLWNWVVANSLAGIARSRSRALHKYAARLRQLGRVLDDTRALARSPELSDTLGRSQREIRALIASLEGVASAARDYSLPDGLPDSPPDGDWPYLAF